MAKRVTLLVDVYDIPAGTFYDVADNIAWINLGTIDDSETTAKMNQVPIDLSDTTKVKVEPLP